MQCHEKPGSAAREAAGQIDDRPASSATTLIRAPRAVHSSFRGGTSILDLRTGQHYRLEGTGFLIWEILGRPVTIEAIEARLAAAYGVAPDTVGPTVSAFVESLRQAGLVLAT